MATQPGMGYVPAFNWDRTARTLGQLREHVSFLSNLRWGDYFGWNGFDAEFREIEMLSHAEVIAGDFTSATLHGNRLKNRYFNVLPFERSRVKLSSEHTSLLGSDYINASYISGHRGPNTYIACQGCTKETLPEFWAMIWAEQSTVIVMLTLVEEGDRPKCYKYWNHTSPKSIFSPDMTPLFTLTPVECQFPQVPGLISRRFQLRNDLLGETREINHFQFVDWPDQRIPGCTNSFRQILRMVDIDNPGPIVVHCSAGIGRTGTFITVHTCLHRARTMAPPVFDVFNTILSIRKERPGMVQTKDQYMFCYMALLEEATEIFAPPSTAPSLPSYLPLHPPPNPPPQPSTPQSPPSFLTTSTSTGSIITSSVSPSPFLSPCDIVVSPTPEMMAFSPSPEMMAFSPSPAFFPPSPYPPPIMSTPFFGEEFFHPGYPFP